MKIRKKLPIESKLTAWRCRVVVLKAAPKEESMVANGIMPPSAVGRASAVCKLRSLLAATASSVLQFSVCPSIRKRQSSEPSHA